MSIFILPGLVILLDIFALGSWCDACRKEQTEMREEQIKWDEVFRYYHQTHNSHYRQKDDTAA